MAFLETITQTGAVRNPDGSTTITYTQLALTTMRDATLLAQNLLPR